MYYSEDFVEEVRGRNDIIDVISSYVNLKRNGSNYVGLCPFHNEKTPSFSVSPGKQMYYCFGCSSGGNVFTFLMEYENLTFVEALEQLADRAGMALPKQTNGDAEKIKRDIRDKILEIYKEAAKFYYALLKSERGQAAREYLQNRKLQEDTIRGFGLGYAHVSGGLYPYMRKKGYEDDLLKQTGLFTYHEKKGVYDKFWNRIVFPIMNRSGKVIAFGGRVMGEGMPKYLNSPETLIFDKSRNLYGLNFVHGKPAAGLILCEGYMDVIALHQAGFTNTVASLGTSLTSQHSSLLKRYSDLVYLCYDSDGAGVKAALRAIPICKEAGLTIKVIDLKPFKDPDELIQNLSAEEFKSRMETARNSFFYEISIMEKEYHMEDPEEKTKFMNEAAKKCLSFENEIERNNYIEAFSREYGIHSEDFRHLVNRIGAELVGTSYRPKEQKSENRKHIDDGYVQAQKFILTWLCEDVTLFRVLEGILDEKDFIEEPYAEIAGMLFHQYHTEGEVVPAKIISTFRSKEEQSLATSFFNSELIIADKPEDKEKALNEVVRHIKKYSLDHQSRTVADISELSNIIQEKKKLEKMYISFNGGKK